MPLFVGRIPQNTRQQDVEDLFAQFGKILRCDVKQGKALDFAFVEYEDKACEDACLDKGLVTALIQWELDGHSLAVEQANGRRQTTGNGCFKCGSEDHWARDCRSGGRDRSRSPRRRSYSRSPRRRSRSRDRERRRSPPRYRDDSRDRSYRRDRSRSPYDDRRSRY